MLSTLATVIGIKGDFVFIFCLKGLEHKVKFRVIVSNETTNCAILSKAGSAKPVMWNRNYLGASKRDCWEQLG